MLSDPTFAVSKNDPQGTYGLFSLKMSEYVVFDVFGQ